MTYEHAVGSRAQVMNGTCHHTKGGLTKKHLKYNKHGRIVSKKMSQRAKRENRLVKAGYVAKKGHFKLFHKGDSKKSHGKKSRKMRGGCLGKNAVLGYSEFKADSNYPTSGVALQTIAGNATG
jgi:hypothetical protein